MLHKVFMKVEKTISVMFVQNSFLNRHQKHVHEKVKWETDM